MRSGTITQIADQVRDPNRVNVFLDGEFAFGLARELVDRHGLMVGQELTAAEVAALLRADEAERATQAALHFLSYRPRSEREVRDRLHRRGFSDEAIAAAIERLERWRYLDDAAFARFWVENRAEHQPRGRRALRAELRAKGVEPELVEVAIDEVGGDEQAAALALARKRVTALRGLDPSVQRRRLAGYLQRRGYDWDTVRRVLDAVLGDDEAAAEGDAPPE
ncbi:MAG: RecX family transcriptional regulator [Sphaerobacter sp.]|nr:RecX family transcriptional regulator [Sphaerobacter sp.]